MRMIGLVDWLSTDMFAAYNSCSFTQRVTGKTLPVYFTEAATTLVFSTVIMAVCSLFNRMLLLTDLIPVHLLYCGQTVMIGCNHTSFEWTRAVRHIYGIIRHMQGLYSIYERILYLFVWGVITSGLLAFWSHPPYHLFCILCVLLNIIIIVCDVEINFE